MSGSRGREVVTMEGKTGPEKDIRNMIIKMALSLLFNFLAKQLRQKQERKKVVARVEKLQKKGKKVPAELMEEARTGMGRRAAKKALRDAARKAEKKKKSRRRLRRLLLLLLLAGAAAAYRASRKSA